MGLANDLAVVGLPGVLEMLRDRGVEPIWNPSGAIYGVLREQDAA